MQTRQRNCRDHLHRYHCKACGKGFIDTTGTFLEATNVSLRRWVYIAREMDGNDKGRASGPIGEEIGLTRKTARRMAKTIRKALHAQGKGWLPRLSGEVEPDDVHVKGGQQGKSSLLASGR